MVMKGAERAKGLWEARQYKEQLFSIWSHPFKTYHLLDMNNLW